MGDVIRLDSKYISLTDDELRKIIPWISAIIEYQINKTAKESEG